VNVGIGVCLGQRVGIGWLADLVQTLRPDLGVGVADIDRVVDPAALAVISALDDIIALVNATDRT
jgi:hypothetical protein